MFKPLDLKSDLKIKKGFDTLNLTKTWQQIKHWVILRELLNHGETILPDDYIRKKNEFDNKKNGRSEIFSKFGDTDS